MRSARWLLAPLALFSLACSGVSPGSEAARTPAPDLTPVLGQWDGEITVGAARIWFIVDCVEDDGRLECTLDYPDAGLERQPLSEVSFVSGRLHFELEGDFGVAVWDGELRRGVVEGDYEESGVSAPFRMRRHPIGPAETIYLDYLVEEVEFASGDFILSGTLTMPLEGAPHPAVVLLSGSGPQTRDYGPGVFPMFRIMADHLTNNGIAVLRYDDPGAGSSIGDPLDVTIDDRIDIISAALDLLLDHDRIDSSRIGLVGHSEGGTVAPRVANQSEHVSFLVLVAGTALTGGEIIRHQNEVILESQGLTGEELSEQLDFVDVVREAVETDTGWEEVEREMRRLLYESIERMSLRERALITDDDAWVDAVAQAQLATLRSPWYRSFYVYDPAVALAELAVPVLAVFAEHDLQIPGQPNEAAMRKALTEAGNPDFTIVTVGDTDHSFQGDYSDTLLEQYDRLEYEFAPGFLDTITDWISGRVREA